MFSSPLLLNLTALEEVIKKASTNVKLQKGFYIHSDELPAELLSEAMLLNKTIHRTVQRWISNRLQNKKRQAWREIRRQQRYLARLRASHKLKKYAG